MVAAEPRQDAKFALMHAYLQKLIGVEIVKRDLKPSESEVISALLLYRVENKGIMPGAPDIRKLIATPQTTGAGESSLAGSAAKRNH